MKATVVRKDLLVALNRISPVIGKQVKKVLPCLRNVRLQVIDDQLEIVGTDIRNAVICNVDASDTDTGVCTTRHSLLMALIKSLTAETVKLSTPGYKQVIPTKFKHEITLDRSNLINITASLLVLANRITHTLIFGIGKDIMVVSATNLDAGNSGAYTIETGENSGSGSKFRFDGVLLRQVLRLSGGENITWRFNDNISASTFQKEGDNGKNLYLLMPLRLDHNVNA